MQRRAPDLSAAPDRGQPRVLLDVPVSFDVGERRTHAPMVKAVVNGTPTQLILDTGSTDHVLTIALARAAGLKHVPTDPGTDHAGASVPTWRLGTVDATIGAQSLVLDNAVAIEGPAPFEGWGVGGFLSPQHLHPTAHTVIDLHNNRLIMVEGDANAVARWLAARLPDHVQLKLPRARQYLTIVVPAAIVPFGTVDTMLNTGGQHTEFAQTAVPSLRGPAPDVTGYGVSGVPVRGYEVRDRTLRVDGAKFKVATLLVRHDMDPPHGLVGMDLLAGTALMVSTDPTQPVVWMVPADTSSE
ncbi:MAG: aspartyl protease family protein [Nannocystaceae bacterium]|nr:aspartyl protease family protein [Nannocystaceae bacterium]